MISLKANIQRLMKYQKPVVELLQSLRSYQVSKFSTSSPETVEKGIQNPAEKDSPNRKVLKVALLGRTNAGKSTLVNKILKLRLCGVSCKSHTTKTPFQAAFTRGDTQIVFVDTPGVVTRKEQSRFNLPENFMEWMTKVLDQVDMIGIIHDGTTPEGVHKLHLQLKQIVNDLPESKNLFLVISKIDLVIDKDALSQTMDAYLKPQNLERPESVKFPSVLKRFSRIFFTSAVTNAGVDEVAEYLLEQAKPGQWLLEPGQVFDEPLDLIVRDLVRSSLMNVLPHEVPYACKYEVDYLKENDLGEIICVCVVTCFKKRHLHLVTCGKVATLRTIAKDIESNLYQILGKVFKLRLVVVLGKK